MVGYNSIVLLILAVGSVHGANKKAFAPADLHVNQLSSLRAGAFGRKEAAHRKAAPVASKKAAPASKTAAPAPSTTVAASAAPKSNVEMYVLFSAVFLSLNAAAVAFAPWETVTDFVIPALNKVEYAQAVQVYLGVSLLGWAVGKFVVYESGPATCKLFCKYNFVTTAILAYYLLSEGYSRDGFSCLALTLGYIYFGYMEDEE
jgi:hypothetical protein